MFTLCHRPYTSLMLVSITLAVACSLPGSSAQTGRPDQTAEQKAIIKRIGGLRSVPDDQRGAVTRQIALDIRGMQQPGVRVSLASGLANLATEGDFGKETLQEVATTLAVALREEPTTTGEGPYLTLAQLVRFEHVKASLDDPRFAAAMKRLVDDDKVREKADFTLNDLQGKPWTLKALRGKVVLVNFWATWCPPCRKEIPDLELLYNRFKDKGFVVLGITDEDASKVTPFVANHPMSYPVLLDPGRTVNKQFSVQGIPRTVIYNRSGKLAAQAIDMRTQKQFLALLSKAGLDEASL